MKTFNDEMTGMNKIPVLLTLCIFLVCVGAGQSINSEKSVVNFKIGNMGVRMVKGNFKGLSGDVSFQADKPASSAFNVCIKAATIDTDNKKRDNHLRTADFFDVEKYPSICFKSTEIKKTDKGYTANGKLTLHGVTKEIQIPFTYKEDTLTGMLTLNRLDYKIGEDTGKFMVGNEVEITITCHLKK